MEVNYSVNTNKKKFRNLLIGFVIVMALFTFFSSTISNISVPLVSLASPESGSLQKVVSSNGTFASKGSIPVNVDFSCRVKEIPVSAGDNVSEGDTLLIFDTDDLSMQLKAEEDTLTKMENDRKKLSLGYTAQDLTQMQVARDNAKEIYEQAKSDYNAVKSQFDAGTATQEQLDEALNALNEAKDSYDIAQSALSHARSMNSNQKKSNNLELANMDIDIAAQQQKVDDLQTFIDNGGKVISSVTGRVLQINTEAGGQASPSQPVINMLDVSEGLEFRSDVSNEDAALIEAGAQVDIKLQGLSKLIPATLREKKDSSAQPGQMIALYFDTVSADIVSVNVQPGQAGDIRYSQQTARYDVTVPNGAIREDSVGAFVLVSEEKDTPLGKQQMLRRVDITVLDSDPFRTAIEGPLSPMDRVVTDSDKPVSDGDKVRVSY